MIVRFSSAVRGASFLLLNPSPSPSPNWRITVKTFTIHLSLLQDSSLAFRFFSSSRQENPKEHSFTVSYLVNSCGLSPQSALSASRKLHLVTPERPDSVLTLLRNYGITDSQLPKLLRSYPSLLLNDPEKTLLPKLQFFHSKEFTGADIGRILSSCPLILSRSLEKQIIPLYNFFKSILHLEKMVVHSLKRSPRLLLESVIKSLVPKIKALREIGVPESSIRFFLRNYPSKLQLKNEKFLEIVKKVVERGFNPMQVAFIHAVQVFAGMSESTWELKMEIYRRWGMSNDEIMLLFRAFPICMSLSEKNIMSTMGFLVNKMGWKLTAITRVPSCLSFSLEKRIIPRCLVVKVLILKGLVRKDLGFGSFLIPTEDEFLGRFVIKYQNQIPELLNLYKGEVGVVELGFASEEMCGFKQL